MAIVNKFLDQLVSTFDHHIDLARNANNPASGMLKNLLQLDRRMPALSALQTLLHTIGVSTPFSATVTKSRTGAGG